MAANSVTSVLCVPRRPELALLNGWQHAANLLEECNRSERLGKHGPGSIRSGFIPRVFGVLLMIAGVGYLASSFATLVLPRYAPLVSKVAFPLEVAEVPIIFWLFIWGAKGVTDGRPRGREVADAKP